MRTALRTATLAGTALLAFTAMSTSASAGTTVSVNTTDSTPGGTGIFWHYIDGDINTEAFGARDNQADGLRAITTITWRSGGALVTRTVEDANGANPVESEIKTVKIPEGTDVTIQVCLKDGPNGRHRFCDHKVAKA
ncbi:hypothetical protein [Streptomyces sp. HC307]|uniref:hypothetical protein n=1 Tax=Streptomyces flavusporus TaxID=3385496 RepID=UPI0039171FBF